MMKSKLFITPWHLLIPVQICLSVISLQAFSAELEEVVVTAQRRAQSLQEVPVSVTAFSSDRLRQLGAITSTDIAMFTPGMSLATTAGEGNKLNVVIRGVGLSSANEEIEGNVAIYQDEVYIGNRSGLNFNLFDVERVEVLRGPQGTHYGNTTTGGLVHYISRKPTDEFEGYVNAQYGEENSARVAGAVSGPLAEGLSARVSGVWNSHDGYFKNTINKNNNKLESGAVRGQVSWDVTPDLNVLVSAQWGENDPGVGPAFKPRVAYINPATGLGEVLPSGLNRFGVCPGCDSGGNSYSTDEQGDYLTRSAEIRGDLRVERKGLGAVITWDIGDATLTSVTNFTYVDKDYAEDADGGPGITLEQFTITDSNQFVQELRLVGETEMLDWSVGAFYYTNDTKSNFGIDFRPGAIAGNPFPPWKQDTYTYSDKTNWSVFGDFSYHVTDSFSLYGGLRYFEEEQERSGFRDRLFTFGLMLNDRVHESEITFDDVTGRVGLQWDIDEEKMAYITVSRGVRPGLLDSERIVRMQLFPLLGEEKLMSYEIGYKADIPEYALRFNASAYYYDYQDRHTRAFEGFNSFLFNVDANVLGLDLEVISNPTDNLELTIAAGFMDGTVENLEYGGDANPASPTFNPLAGTTRDTELPNAPDLTLSGLARYTWPLGNGANISLVVSGSYRSSSYSEAQNNPVQKIPSYTVVNSRLAYTSPDGRWSAGAYVNNIFDEEYISFVGFVTSIGVAQQFVGRPRFAGAFINYNFN